MPFLRFSVPLDYTKNERIDKYIANLPDGMNRSKLKSGMNQILINDKNAKLSQKIKAGDKIDISWDDNVPDDIIPQNIPLDIIYEDENVTVVNKKTGMVTHPACGNWEGTLVNALLYHWGRQSITDLNKGSESEILKRRRPGIVHRLDKETSGIIITAKNRDSEEWLLKQFKDKCMQKEYICICCGKPTKKAGDIRTQIIRDPKNRQRFKAVENTDEGKFARTLTSLYSSGIPMVECLERSSRILGNKYVDKMFLQVVDEVKQGSPVSQSLAKTEIFEGMFCSIIYVGEESGALDDILAKTADYYEEEADAAVTRMVGLLEPVLIIFMGVCIGLCLAGIFPLLYGSLSGIE